MTLAELAGRGNAMKILHLLRAHPLSRAELARQTGLSRAAVTGIAEELLRSGVLREGAVPKTAAGRRPTLLEPDPEACRIVGIDLSRDGAALCVCDFTLTPVYKRCWDKDTPRARVLLELEEELKRAQRAHPLLGVGVVAPGPIDPIAGRVFEPVGLEPWHGFCLSELAVGTDVPVILARDTAALALAEKRYAADKESFLVLLGDHGLGGGFVYGGRLFASAGGNGCEIGHVSIDENGPVCPCGNRGCAELYASIPGAISYVKEKRGRLSWCKLVALAEEGDAVCLAALDRQATALATACVSAVNMLEPERILLEGELGIATAFLKPRIEATLRQRCFTASGRRVTVERSALPEDARALAAANLALENFFEEMGK